jgi:uncharacterized protein
MTDATPDRENSSPPHPAPARSRQLSILVTVVVVTVIAVLLVAFVGFAVGRHTRSAAGRISVSGTAKVKGTPNTATFSIGIATTNPNAETAMNLNNAQVERLERALASHGVAAADLQTSNLSVNANYNDRDDITGFSVTNTVSVTMHQIKNVGAAIEAAARVAGNGIELNGISFSISDSSFLVAHARAAAIRNAHAAASQLASAGGTSLAGVITITDQENLNNFQYPSEPLDEFDATDLSAASVPIEAGSQNISVTVQVVYALSN